MCKAHRNYGFKAGNQRLFLWNIIWRQNLISLITVCEVRVSRFQFFTVNFVFENVMCKVKHYFPGWYTLGTEAACYTFGMVFVYTCMEIVNNS